MNNTKDITRKEFNLQYWPTFVTACISIALYKNGLGEGWYWTCIILWGFSVYLLATRLKCTKVSAWLTLVVLLPMGQLVLSLVTSFLNDREA